MAVVFIVLHLSLHLFFFFRKFRDPSDVRSKMSCKKLCTCYSKHVFFATDYSSNIAFFIKKGASCFVFLYYSRPLRSLISDFLLSNDDLNIINCTLVYFESMSYYVIFFTFYDYLCISLTIWTPSNIIYLVYN